MMEADASVFVMGLGVSYPKGADGTTAGLKQKYPERVFDVPVSEAAFTGMAVGAAINGLHPIVHHGRVEFSLLASDAIFTQAANWNYMFGGDNPVPIVLRINLGRQWGNGPQHTNNPYALFGGKPGLKVVVPSSPKMAKGLLISALKEKSPVVMLEPRWLFDTRQNVPVEVYSIPLDKARVVKEGADITVVAYGDGLFSAREAIALVKDTASVELIDLVSINPVDHETIHASIKKTGRLLTVDTTSGAFSVGSEIIAKAAEGSVGFTEAPRSVAAPDVPCPTSPGLSEFYYPTKIDIANAILAMFNKPPLETKLSFEELHIAPKDTLEE